jgi:hypothetical protein
MKYVIISYLGLEVPIVFPDVLLHATFQHKNVISAGECRVVALGNEGECRFETWGESIGLNKPSRGQDARVLNNRMSE